MFKNILKFAWRNTWRNKRRTFFTLLALTIGVMSIIFSKSYIDGIMKSSVDAIIKSQTGHIRIAHPEFLRLERIMPKEYMVTSPTRISTLLEKEYGSQIFALDERIKFNALLSHGEANETAIAVGIEPLQTDKTMELSDLIIQGRYFTQESPGSEMIIGKPLAKKLNVSVKDEILLVTTDVNYSTYALPFKVAGIFESGFPSMDKHQIYISLKKAQEMLDCGDSVQEIMVFLKDPSEAIAIAEKIKKLDQNTHSSDKDETLSVIPWQKSDIMETTVLMDKVYGVLMGIIMLIVALVVLNTMLMAVMERYHETGVIKTLGFKNREVFGMVITEAFYLGTIGSLIGGILGGSISLILEKTGIDISKMINQEILEKVDIPIPFFDKILYPQFSLAFFFTGIGFGIAIALLAVIYPAIKSSRMQPVEAFRSNLKI